MEAAALALRFGLGAIFLTSGIAKLANQGEFEQVVREYRAVPESIGRAVTKVVPLAETALGLCFLLGVAVKPAALVSIVLLLVFTVAITVNLMRGRRIACGCFGTLSSREVSSYAVARNVGLSVSALVVAGWAPTVLAVDGWLGLGGSPGELSGNDAIAVLILGINGAFLLAIFQEAGTVVRVHRALIRSLARDR
ncbi:MAG: DoxX family membrane protein [Dehalococcoidia bacterium]|nr:DoxX family membrane protein [Dehalococcoidia bacterium]